MFDPEMLLSENKEEFLANILDKQKFIMLVGERMFRYHDKMSTGIKTNSAKSPPPYFCCSETALFTGVLSGTGVGVLGC